MTSVDKAAMGWSIAIVAVAIGFTATGQSFTTEISPSETRSTEGEMVKEKIYEFGVSLLAEEINYNLLNQVDTAQCNGINNDYDDNLKTCTSESGQCYAKIDDRGGDVRYGWHTGAGFGGGNKQLDSVDCASKHHDSFTWKTKGGGEINLKEYPRTNHCALSKVLDEMTIPSGQADTLRANDVVATKMKPVCVLGLAR